MDWGRADRGWRQLLRVGVLPVLVVVGLAACSGDDGAPAAGQPDTSAATATTATVAGPLSPIDNTTTYGVGRREETFVDESRGTDEVSIRGLPAQDSRTLASIILFPTDAGADGAQEPAGGTFPLVVFSHGNGGNATLYAPFLEPLARRGYVVVLPNFPITSVRGAPLDDVKNQPGDVSFVIDELLRMSDDGDSWLADRVDPDRIAAAGHSLGAVTTVGVAYDGCCVDPRVRAAVVVSGVAAPSGDGTLDDRPPTPLLLIHGALDNVVPVGGGDDLFAAATGPTYYLRFANADHFGFAAGTDGELTVQAVVAFLDSELKGHPEALAAMPDAAAAAGTAQWQTRG